MSVLVAKCKTDDCENDLLIDGQDLPNFDPNRPTMVRAKFFDRIDLTCDVCLKTHSYEPGDCFEKAQ
jgi:hypothetical protein